MALIVEDGSIVENANSYVTVEEIRAFSNSVGLEIPDDDTSLEQNASTAFYFLNGFRYKGYRVDKLQPGAFPRECLMVDGIVFDVNEIPNAVKTAQIYLTSEAATGALSLSSGGASLTQSLKGVKSARVEGAVSIELQSNQTLTENNYINTSLQANFPLVYGLLYPFLVDEAKEDLYEEYGIHQGWLVR